MSAMIEVRDLVKNYGAICAVDHISFSVPEGEIFGFLGPNGAGKTTTIKMLTTVLQPTSGELRVNGFDPRTQQKQVRRSFGIVFQDPSLDSELTALENMEIHGVLYGVPAAERKQRIESLFRFVELWDRRNDFIKLFSGGMKRRAEVARALLHQPKILFLDEPTIGLDPQTRNHIWSSIRTLSKEQKVTVFFTTHYMEEADRVADRVAIIDHGKIVAQGSPGELKEQTQSKTLEDAFISLTGRNIREEEASATDQMRMLGQGLEGPLMSAIYILWLRQLKRYTRSRARIVGSLGQPLVFLLALGFGFGPTFSRAGGGNYIEFLAPGVIAMGILFTAVFTGIEIIWDRQFGFLKETLVAPVSRLQIVLGRTLGGATVAVLQGTIVLVICLLAGFRFQSFVYLPAALIFMFLIAVLFTAIGTAVGSVLEDMQGFQLIMNFIVMPLFFFSNALFPVQGLPKTLQAVVHLNPLTYGVDGIRGSFSHSFVFGMGTDFAVLGALTAILLGIGSYLFSRIQL